MIDDVPRRRRRAPSQFSLSVIDPVEASCQAALSAEPGSEEATRGSQEALFHLLQRLRPALPQFGTDGLAGMAPEERRGRWIALLRFLAGTQMLSELEPLSLALAELDRGVTDAALLATPGGRRGGLSTTSELQLMSFAVEAADELKSRCAKVEEYRAELQESETSHSTIEGYRKKVASGPHELWPQSSYFLAWGATPPELLLQQIVWALRDLRTAKAERKPR